MDCQFLQLLDNNMGPKDNTLDLDHHFAHKKQQKTRKEIEFLSPDVSLVNEGNNVSQLSQQSTLMQQHEKLLME